jgi:hypothetical protein
LATGGCPKLARPTSVKTDNNRYQINCEGFAYMGSVALQAAGFTKIALISNNAFRVGLPQSGQTVAQARLQMLQTEFRTIMGQPFRNNNADDRIYQHADLEGSQTIQ